MTIDVQADVGPLDRLEKSLTARLSAIVRTYAFSVEAAAKVAILTGTKSGRVYQRKGGKTHQASAAGEAPANDTSALANSIRAQSEQGLTWRVSASARYAAPLELGTKRMAPRPFLAPALESVKDKFVAAVKAVFDGV